MVRTSLHLYHVKMNNHHQEEEEELKECQAFRHARAPQSFHDKHENMAND